MSPEYYKEVLELAVLQACEEELERLKRLRSDAGAPISEEISTGLGYLGDLQSGYKPDYGNPWVPLLHASWYQLRHVNFLLTEMAHRLKKHAHSDVIRVIDRGCGTMPVMWTIALVLADPVNGMMNQKVEIRNNDHSEKMKTLGSSMWEKLKEVVGKRQDLDEGGRLYDAIHRVTESETKFKSHPHLLTAIHCLYEKEDLQNVPRILAKEKFITLNQGQAKNLRLRIDKKINGRWSGNLEKLTEFRKEKIGSLCQHHFLKRQVKWDSTDVVLVVL